MDKVRYSFGVTINIGNYENVKISIARETEVEDGETPAMALERLKEWVQEEADKEIADAKGK